LCEWDEMERKGIDRIPSNGHFILDRKELTEYNKIGLDSIDFVYRNVRRRGFFRFRVSLKKDTIHQIIPSSTLAL
jgi:hypothetical protein